MTTEICLNKEELEKLLNVELSLAEFTLLNEIYVYHPIFIKHNQQSIERLQQLYAIGGTKLMAELAAPAYRVKRIKSDINVHNQEIKNLQDELNTFINDYNKVKNDQ